MAEGAAARDGDERGDGAMLRVIMISAILSAVVALLAEIICSEEKAKAFWLGAVALYFIISSGAFWLFWNDGLEGDIAKQIIVFLVIGMLSFLGAVLVASVVITLIRKWEEEEEKKKQEEKSGEAEESGEEQTDRAG